MSAFATLSQQTRLDVFRLLAGQIGTRLGVLQNSLSTNLNILVNAGLVRRSRQGRSIRYLLTLTVCSPDLAGMLSRQCMEIDD